MNLLSTVTEVREVAYAHLVWMIVLPVVSVWSYLLDGVFIGAIWSREMRNGMAISLVVFAVLLPWATATWGNQGLWAAFTLFIGMRGITMAAMYPRLAGGVGQGSRPEEG